MLDQAAWDGVQLLLDEYIDIQVTDAVIVAFTADSAVGAAWVSVALEQRGSSPHLLEMEPLQDPTFEPRIKALLADLPSDIRVVILTLEKHTMSHTSTIRKIVDEYGPDKITVIRAMSASAELFSHAIVPPSRLEALNNHLLNHLARAQKLRITTPSGTDLAVEIDSKRFRWISNCGLPRNGVVTILPAGEVATYPARINGILAADFALHVNMFTDLDVRLKKSPVCVDVQEGSLVGFRCADSAISDFIQQCLEHPGATVVGELGFGTNFGVRKATIINSHINERVPGVHLGFGQHNQRGILPSTCEIHLDLIARGGRVWVDDCETPLDLSHLVPARADHCVTIQDEDVFSPEVSTGDCCGSDTECLVAGQSSMR